MVRLQMVVPMKKYKEKHKEAAARVHEVLLSHRRRGHKFMSKEELCRCAEVDERTIRQANEYLRSRGIMAFSSGEGYYLALTAEEIQPAYKFRKAYAMTILADLKHIKRAYLKLGAGQAGQMELI